MTGSKASVVTSVRSCAQNPRLRSKVASAHLHTRHNKGRRFDVVWHLVHVGRTRKEEDGHERSEAEERRGLSEVGEQEHAPFGAQGTPPASGAQAERARQACQSLAGHHLSAIAGEARPRAPPWWTQEEGGPWGGPPVNPLF